MNLTFSIEKASNTGNARGMYEGIKQATGPNGRKVALLKSKSVDFITDGKKQIERCVRNSQLICIGEILMAFLYRGLCPL